MKRVWIILSIAVFLLTSLWPLLPTVAQEAQPIAEVQASTLDNGLQVLMVARDGAPVTVVDVWVNVGSINETPEINGISHFFEHMVFKGTEKRPGTVDAEVASMGGRTNAATSFDWTHYYVVVPSERTEQALDLMADITQNATFPEAEIAREKEVVLRELDQRSDDPEQFLSFTLYQEFFQQHPYGLSVIGSAESLGRLTRDDFLRFMRQYYVPNNMVLVIVGDFDVAKTLPVVQAKFGGMKRQELPKLQVVPEPPRTTKAIKEIRRDVNQGYLVFGWPAPSIRQPRDVYAMDVLLAILSHGRGSRFYKRIFKELELVTDIQADFFTQKDPSIFSVYAAFPYENRALVEEAILAELQRVLNGDLSEAELERAKTILLSEYALSTEANAGLASTLGFYAIVAGDYRFALSYPEGIRGLTVKDVVEVARKYIDPERYLEIVLVPEGQKPAELQPLAAAGVTLDNGLKIFLREDHTSDVVAVQAFVGTGTRVETLEQAGIAMLTQRLLLRGTQTRSEEEIFEEIENLGAMLGQAVLADMAHLYLVATEDTLERALPIFLDVLLNPAFAEDELAHLKDQTLREIQAEGDQNFSVIYNNFQRALYGEQGYGHSALGTIESVQALTRDDIVRFYRQYYVPNNMVIAVVGDFDASRLLALLKARLGNLTYAPELPAKPPLQVQLAENREVVTEKDSNLVWMMVGFPGPAVGSPDYPAMKVLNAIVGGDMSSRLFSILRDQQGLAYSTGSLFPSRQADSHFATYIIVLPENAERAREGILEILEDIKEHGVTAEELARAQSSIIGNYLIDHETAERRAWYLGWYEMLGVGVAMDEKYPQLIRQVTSEDVQRVAEKYLRTYIVSLLRPRGER
jgi:zinc protease